jgi:CO/xanthine dehydrogenase Mo-binding subunit
VKGSIIRKAARAVPLVSDLTTRNHTPEAEPSCPVIDGGRILNPIPARNQFEGAAVMGIGIALFESNDFADLVFNDLGVRGIGEIGVVGVAAAIASAAWHACACAKVAHPS